MGIFLFQLNMQFNCIVLFNAEYQHDLNVYTLIKVENRALSKVWNSLRNNQRQQICCVDPLVFRGPPKFALKSRGPVRFANMKSFCKSKHKHSTPW